MLLVFDVVKVLFVIVVEVEVALLEGKTHLDPLIAWHSSSSSGDAVVDAVLISKG